MAQIQTTGRAEVVVVDERRELAWQTVSTPLFPDSTVWRIRLGPVEGWTRIVREFDVVRTPKPLDRLYAAVMPSHRDRRERLKADRQRIGALAGQPARPPV